MKKRMLSLALAALMCVSVFAGCSSGAASSSPASSAQPDSTSSEAAKDELGADFAGYPIETDETISLYLLDGGSCYAVPDGVERQDNEWEKGLTERLGVNIEWQSIPAGSDASQAYNLMIAGDDLPDVFYGWHMPGRAAQLIEDGKVIALNDQLATYAPAYYNFVTADDSIDKAVKDDNGNYYGFAFLRENLKLGTYAGMIVREDLLTELKLEAPQTIADWDNVLHAFKNAGVKYPLSTRDKLRGILETFAPGYGFGLSGDYFIGDDGKVHYGYAEAGLKDLLTQVKAWYDDGLIDPDFMTNDSAALETKLLNGEVGACRTTGGTVAGYVTKLQAMNSSVSWVATVNAVENAGDKQTFIQGESNNLGIVAMVTTSCKNVPLALRVMDYGYTEDGMIYYNFGSEDNYDIVDGDPIFKDSFNNDTRGVTVMMQTYTAMAGNSVTLCMAAAFKGFTEFRQACVNTWYEESALKHIMPGSITLSTEESDSIASEATAIGAYAGEMVAKFILGQESLDNFDAYLAQLNNLGLEHVLEVRQAGYDRYLNR